MIHIQAFPKLLAALALYHRPKNTLMPPQNHSIEGLHSNLSTAAFSTAKSWYFRKMIPSKPNISVEFLVIYTCAR